MEATKESLEAVISELAIELQKLRAMESTEGWKVLDAEAKLTLASDYEALTTCNEGAVPRIQGRIAAIKWLMSHSLRVAQRLTELETQLRETAPTE